MVILACNATEEGWGLMERRRLRLKGLTWKKKDREKGEAEGLVCTARSEDDVSCTIRNFSALPNPGDTSTVYLPHHGANKHSKVGSPPQHATNVVQFSWGMQKAIDVGMCCPC
ncbi:Hypothetical protein NTJ_03122 [Nesidiocoris tenuis]|uniref:Uncharacterized protein n=1 Tax=Nesidiocoris tenuis TaxID=355587 RepID=A0ABN7AGI9_9HEMI|nr:Hypothetical protein NTJ_03122 [Nesidiocoris tenuis]